MRRRILTILLVPCLLATMLAPLLPAPKASAASSCPSGPSGQKFTNVAGVQLVVCLENNGNKLSNAQGYTVKVDQTIDEKGSDTTKKVTYDTAYGGGYYYTTQGIEGIDNGTDCQDDPTYNLTVSVQKGSTTYPSKTVDLCGAATGAYFTDVSVTPGQQTGCFQVTDATYKSDAGGSIPYTHTATAVLAQQGATTKQLVFDDSGNISKICGIPVGDYTFKASFNPTDPSVGTLDRVIQVNGTIKAGQTWTLNKPVGKEGTAPAPPVAPGGGATAPDTSDSCENGFPLAWILCSVISGAANLITGMYKDLIDPILDQPQSSMLLDTSKPYYQVWSNFRIYGDVILVIALLVIVFGESIGGGMIDAYTAKKVLPRLVIAAVLINLSIYVVAVAVDITSILGHGIYSLFVLPFHSATVPSATPGSPAETVNLSGVGLHLNVFGDLFTMLAGGAGLIWVATTSGFVHFLFVTVLGGGALVFFGVLITLTLRVAIIMGLIFVSPVAFALYCLPNTEQYFRKWWDLLFRALLVYPIVGAIFALANITAVTLSNLPMPSGITAGFAQVLGLFAQFAPLVMVPFAFRLAGGAIGAVHQGVNSRVTAPGLKGLANVRARRRQVLHERRMNAQDKMGTGRTGRLYRGVATLGSKDSWSPTRRGRSRFAAYNQTVVDRAAAKRLEEGGQRAFSDDDASAAASRARSGNEFLDIYEGLGHSRDEARAALGRVESSIGARVGSDAVTVAAQKYRTAMSQTAYQGEAGLTELQGDLQRLVAQGLITQDDAAGWMKANKGRADISSNGWNDTVAFVQGTQTARDQIRGAFRGADPRDIVGSHQMGVENMAEQARINFDEAIAELNAARESGDADRIATAERNRSIASADIAGIYDTLGHSSPRKAQEFADNVFGRGVRVRTTVGPVANADDVQWDDLTVRQLMEDDRTRAPGPNGEQTFLERRREYANAAAANNAGNIEQVMQPPPEGT